MRISSLCLLSLLFLVALPSALKSQAIDIGEAVRAGEGRVALAVESSDENIRNLARRAFGLHGAIDVTTPANAAFTVRIEPAGGGNAALLTVGSGTPFQEQLRRTVPGRDLNNAVLRACDLVVEATLQSKGFFAGRLAFVGKRGGVSEIYVGDLLFTQVRPVTRDRALVTGPRWAPDGSRLLFTTYFNTGFPDIYQINLATGRRTPIATYRGTNTGGVFSPDGRRIAMALSGRGDSKIFVADSNGRNPRRLTSMNGLEASPSWSPDGRRLVFTSDAPGRPQLYQAPVDGGNPQRIPTNISNSVTEPAWNPVDPNKIAFTAVIAGGFQIAVYDFEARESRQITTGASSVEPAWLSDGRHLVFTRREGGGRTRLMVVDSETGKVSALHQPDQNASSAHFVY